MCEPVSAMMIVGSALSGAQSLGLIGNKGQGAPSAPQMPSEPPKPQAAATPDQSAMRRNAANRAGAVGTLLTGASGVNPSLLNTGKNTLLGA